MRLVVTEKPSVARDLGAVLGATKRAGACYEGQGLRITWCLGHLTELEDPAHYDAAWRRWRLDTLPMLPERFDLRVRKGAKDHWKAVRSLLRDRSIDEVINACDAGREGELIFRNVYLMAGCKAPVRRLWIASLTERAIRDGWASLQPSADFDRLADAARCRAEADWLVGLNATRALTVRARDATTEGPVLSVGRVQTPTLAMIVGRDQAIADFVPEPYWLVDATFEVPAADGQPARWVGRWWAGGADGLKKSKGEKDEAPPAERVPTEAMAKAIATAAEGQQGVVATAKKQERRVPPPLLYDLTSLQRRANVRFGFRADQTLQLAQTLYEQKLISYPRTDSRHITQDQVPQLPDVVRGVGKIGVYAPFAQAVLANRRRLGKRVVDASEVGDHHAILPTGKPPNPKRLSVEEKRIYDLVARRLLAVLSPDAVFDHTTLVVEVPPGRPLPEGVTPPLAFRARGRICREAGWRAVDPPGRDRQRDLPLVDEGATATVAATEVKDRQTRPPPPHNDASLLRGMETAGKDLEDKTLVRAMRKKGLGTPATRANILKTLLARGYIERKARTLRSTELGRTVIVALVVEELKSAELTGQWEARLSDMADGKGRRAAFMNDVRAHVQSIVSAIADGEAPAIAAQAPTTKPLGMCPRCGTPVRERRMVFACDTGRTCGFAIFKKRSKRNVSSRMIQQLLRDGRSKVVKGFVSKAGKPFSAGLILEEDGKVGFYFPPRRGQTRTKPTATPSKVVGRPCPRCRKGRVIRGRTAWGCSAWRAGCELRIPFSVDGTALTEADAAARLDLEAG